MRPPRGATALSFPDSASSIQATFLQGSKTLPRRLVSKNLDGNTYLVRVNCLSLFRNFLINEELGRSTQAATWVGSEAVTNPSSHFSRFFFLCDSSAL